MREEEGVPQSRQTVTRGVISNKSGQNQNPPKSVTFGAAPTLCVPDTSFEENNMVGHQTDTFRPLSSKDQSLQPSSSSRVSNLEYEEELEERRRQRSAVLQSIGSNEKQRKLSANRITAAKRRREEEKRRQQKHHQVIQPIDEYSRNGKSLILMETNQVIQPLPPVKEDVEGEELAGEHEWSRMRGPGTHIADFVVHNRIWKQFGNTGMYLAVIQQLLELGDARRKSWTSWNSDDDTSSTSCSSSGDEEEIFPFTNKLRSRKMSLSGVLDQSNAERRGFASLLQQKLERLSMEDDVESEVGQQLKITFGDLRYFLRILS